MVFSSLTFLFLYLPLTLLVYFLSPLRWRNFVLLVVSLLFYGWGEPVYIVIMFLSIIIDYTHGLLVEKFRSDDKKARWFVAQSVIFNLALLGFFKYWDFIAANLSLIPGIDLPQLGIPLPIGISFYTFQTMSYTIDVYRKDAPVQRNMVDFGAFVTMFPQLIAGPIVQYKTVAADLRHRLHTSENFALGARRFCVGLAKKVLLADSLAPAADAVFHAAAQGLPLSTAEAWLGALSYTFQIYFDFSGYTDMAVGAALMLGLRLPENFAAPYKATGIVDFWRRWHMTLGRWLHDCLYLPLGGSRHGRVRQYANLLLTMLVCGVWHGAGLTFLLWGALHGLLLLVNHAFRHLLRGSLAERVLALPPLRALCVLVTFLCLTVAWVLFRAGDTGTALHVWQSMFLWSDGHPLPLQQGLEALLPGGLLEPRLLLPLLAVCTVIVWGLPCSQHVMLGRADGSRPWLHWQPNLLWAVALALPALASLLLMQGHAFLSFRF